MKTYKILLLALLVVFAVRTAYAQYDNTNYGAIAFGTPTVVAGQSTTITLTVTGDAAGGCAYLTSGCNIVLVQLPTTNEEYINGQWANQDPFTAGSLPTCSSIAPDSGDECIAAQVSGWGGAPGYGSGAGNPAISTQSYPWMASGSYYYLAYIEPAGEGCGYSSQYGEPCYDDISAVLVVVPTVQPWLSVGGSTNPPSQNSGVFEILPGASAYLNFTYFGVQCNGESFLEIGNPATGCVSPDTLSDVSTDASNPYDVTAYCSENTASAYVYPSYTPPGVQYTGSGISVNGAIYPWPSCLADVAQVYDVDAPGGVQSYCSLVYFTNETMLQGNYPICGYWQNVGPNGAGGTSGIGSFVQATNYLNITTNDSTGPSFGLYLTNSVDEFLASDPTETIYLNANTEVGSPYYTYYESIEQSTPAQLCNIGSTQADKEFAADTGAGCFIELANDTTAGGCVAPNIPPSIQSSGTAPAVPSSALYECGEAGAGGKLPCLLASSTQLSGETPVQVSLPSGEFQDNGNYLICAYDYIGVGYPYDEISPSSTSNYPSFYSSGTYFPSVNGNKYYPALSIFFASANIICNDLNECYVGVSDQQQPSRYLSQSGLPQTAIGSIVPVPDPISAATGPATVTATVQDVANTIPFSLTSFPYREPPTTAPQNFGTICAAAAGYASTSCAGAQSDSTGCSMSFEANPSYTNNCEQLSGTDSGYLSSLTCTCSGSVPYGCTRDPNNPNNIICPTTCTETGGVVTCPIQCTTSNPPTCSPQSNVGTTDFPYPDSSSCTITYQSLPSSQLTPGGQYAYCATYPNDQGYVAGAFLEVSLQPTSPGTIQNLGIANTIPLATALCSFYGEITQLLLILSLIIVLIGAVVYMGTTVLPAQQRGIFQSYGMGMFIAGIVGAAMVGLSAFIVSQTSNIVVPPFAACPTSSVPPTSISTTTITTSSSTSSSSTSTSTSSTSSTSSTTTTSISTQFSVYDNCESSGSGCTSPTYVTFSAACMGSTCSSTGPTVILDFGTALCPTSQPSQLPDYCGTNSYTAPPSSPCLLAQQSDPFAERGYYVSAGKSGAIDNICAYTSTSGGPLSASTKLVIQPEQITTTIESTCLGCSSGTCPIHNHCCPVSGVCSSGQGYECEPGTTCT